MMARRWLISGLLAAAASAQMHAASAQTTSPPFPRLGGYLIGGSNTNLSVSSVAQLNVVVLGTYPGWRTNSGQTPQQFLAAVKAINPTIRMFIYTDINELEYPIVSAYAGLEPINTYGWWLTTSGTTGSKVPSNYGGNFYEINTTTKSQINGSGQNYLAFRSAWDVAQYLTPNPAADGIYVDNVFWAPRVNGDWTLSGSIQGDSSATTQQLYRLGFVNYFQRVKALIGSSRYVLGNTGDWGGSSTITEYQGVLNGGVMESMIGQSYSYESQGWATMMASYTKIMSATAQPQLMIFAQDGGTTDYQGMRYGLCSSLLGNAYYFYDQGGGGNQNYNNFIAFDEFGANLGVALTGPLVFPGAAAWQNGVYRRDFQNGIALVNPRGNGPQTVTLEATYQHLSGTQAPSVNNGQTVTKVTVNDRDGVILLRTTTQLVPAAPALTVQ